ncbi:MAG: carbohydrate kinase family protein, partial [Gammaproteobacteria bacterium]|nr:carbohydrate kinase family protein [Gammaproteobacteria bacterium]
AGNIAFNLQLLGGEGKPMATVGEDFGPYAQWLDQHGIARDALREVAGTYTAQAYITTDQDDNQITAFHPGAMNHAHEIKVSDFAGVTLGMVSPDGRQGMIEHAEQFVEADIPFIFDPGQGMPMFDGDDLNRFARQATWLAFNDYEAKLMQERTGKSPAQLAREVEAVFVTRGGQGSTIYTAGREIEIPLAPARQLVDPTGCGDAYRGGLLYGLQNDMDWDITGRIASLMGSIKIEHAGTQNHALSRADFNARFHETFGISLT